MSIRRSGRSLCLLAYTFIEAPKTYTIKIVEAGENFLKISSFFFEKVKISSLIDHNVVTMAHLRTCLKKKILFSFHI
jgi:hypothetical protein